MSGKLLSVQSGQRFGRGVVIEAQARTEPTPGRPQGRRAAVLECDCGQTYVASLQALYSGRITSCGCLSREVLARPVPWTKHGKVRHPLYGTWLHMMRRCYKEDDRAYPNYGGRGIRVWEPWHDAAVFIREVEQLLGPRPVRQTLDREDNDGAYEPGNLRWASRHQQAWNRRSPQGHIYSWGDSWGFRVSVGGWNSREEAEEAKVRAIALLRDAGIIRL